MASLSFTWSARRDGNSGFVLEEAIHRDGSLEYRFEYGPMPPHIVPQFIKSRRRIVHLAQRADGSLPVLE